MGEIYIVRHAATRLNERGIVYGSTDPPLNIRGREQARDLKRKIDLTRAGLLDDPQTIIFPEEIAAVHISPLLRAQQTAVLVSPGMNNSITDPRITERCVGYYEGLTLDEIYRLTDTEVPKEEFVRHLHSYYTVPPGPGGESIAQMEEKRVLPFLEDVRKRYGDNPILVFTHSIFAQSARYCLHPEIPIEKRRYRVNGLKPCEIIKLEI